MGSPVIITSMLTIVLTTFLLSLSSAAPRADSTGDIEIRDCGSKVDIQRIEFDQCDDFPCVVHHGQTATGRATMVAQAATNTLTCKVPFTNWLIIDKVRGVVKVCLNLTCQKLFHATRRA